MTTARAAALACVALLGLALGALLLARPAVDRDGAPLRAAVAANFAAACGDLAAAWTDRTGHEVVPSFGSTGQLYAQIRNGAPFDLFFAADAARPRLLEAEGLAAAGSRATYAVGRLALWSPVPGLVDSAGAVPGTGGFAHLALADPELAPYGAAARAVLQGRGLWEALQPRLVFGRSVTQAHQFIASGNAELGFVAWSQLQAPGRAPAGSWWLVPADRHPPLVQQAVVLSDAPAARAFLDFVTGDEGRRILAAHGYESP